MSGKYASGLNPVDIIGIFLQVTQPSPETEVGEGVKQISVPEELSREHAMTDRILMAIENVLVTGQGNPDMDLTPINRAARLINESLIEHHAEFEEKYLYPKLEGRMSRFIDVLKTQHNQIKQANTLIMDLSGKDRLDNDMERDEMLLLCKGMKDLITAHAAWEETVLFPAVYEYLSDRDIRQLNDQMRMMEKEEEKKGGIERQFKELLDIESMAGTDDLSSFNLM